MMYDNNTRQGYARLSTLKPAGYFFTAQEKAGWHQLQQAGVTWKQQITLLRRQGRQPHGQASTLHYSNAIAPQLVKVQSNP